MNVLLQITACDCKTFKFHGRLIFANCQKQPFFASIKFPDSKIYMYLTHVVAAILWGFNFVNLQVSQN